MSKIRKITDHVYVTPSAIVEFGGGGKDVAYGNERAYGLNSSHEPWGDKDRILHEMHKISCDNPTKWRLMTTRRDFVIGKGITITKDGLLPDALKADVDVRFSKARLKALGVGELITKLALSLEFCSRFFVKLTLADDFTVESLELVDVFHCRPRRMVAGETKISAYIINPNFGTKKYRKADDVAIPAFDMKSPKKYMVSIIDVREYLPGQIYHPFGFWWGTADWTKVANKVPKFHDNGLDNGYNIKYHVSIPDNYFEDDELTKPEQDELKMEVCSKIDETLKGKTDTVLFTFHAIDVNGKEISGVKITPLQNNMSDDAYTTIFNTANIAQASAHGVLPILAGIDTGSKLGGSGKELEVAANYIQEFLTFRNRTLLLGVIEVVRLIENWNEDLVFEFENAKIYTFDVTPAAANNNQNQNQ